MSLNLPHDWPVPMTALRQAGVEAHTQRLIDETIDRVRATRRGRFIWWLSGKIGARL